MSADGRNGERLQEVGVEIDTWWNVNEGRSWENDDGN